MDNWLNYSVAALIGAAYSGLVFLAWAQGVVRRANEFTHAALDEAHVKYAQEFDLRRDWERKAEEFRRLNSSILEERDKWQTLYWSQSAGAQGAQAMMMATIDHLAGRLRALGQKVEVPAVIQATMDEFVERHVNSVSREPGTPQIPRPAQTGSQVPDITSTEQSQAKES